MNKQQKSGFDFKPLFCSRVTFWEKRSGWSDLNARPHGLYTAIYNPSVFHQKKDEKNKSQKAL